VKRKDTSRLRTSWRCSRYLTSQYSSTKYKTVSSTPRFTKIKWPLTILRSTSTISDQTFFLLFTISNILLYLYWKIMSLSFYNEWWQTTN
jgi:hypothetical protein